jgi:hypothetical protein
VTARNVIGYLGDSVVQSGDIDAELWKAHSEALEQTLGDTSAGDLGTCPSDRGKKSKPEADQCFEEDAENRGSMLAPRKAEVR